MTGSFLAPIIIPIVAFLALAAMLGIVYWANAHPGWKAHSAAPSSGGFPRAAGPGDHRGSELAPPPQDGKAT